MFRISIQRNNRENSIQNNTADNNHLTVQPTFLEITPTVSARQVSKNCHLITFLQLIDSGIQQILKAKAFQFTASCGDSTVLQENQTYKTAKKDSFQPRVSNVIQDTPYSYSLLSEGNQTLCRLTVSTMKTFLSATFKGHQFIDRFRQGQFLDDWTINSYRKSASITGEKLSSSRNTLFVTFYVSCHLNGVY